MLPVEDTYITKFPGETKKDKGQRRRCERQDVSICGKTNARGRWRIMTYYLMKTGGKCDTVNGLCQMQFWSAELRRNNYAWYLFSSMLRKEWNEAALRHQLLLLLLWTWWKEEEQWGRSYSLGRVTPESCRASGGDFPMTLRGKWVVGES